MASTIFTRMGSVIKNYVESVSYTWITKTSDYNILPFEAVACDTTGGAITLTLPDTPNLGDQVKILDVSANFAIANVIVGRNGKKIMGLDEDMTISTNNVSVELVFVNDVVGWRIL